jgi:CheY-like chemotaxis protein
MHFAASGPEALDRLAGEIQPILAAVLSDINMPGMDRLQLLGEIKRRRPDLPVMMVTAYGDDERRRRARELGAFEFITKPLDFDQLKGRNPAGSVEPCLYRAAKLSSAHRLRAARRRCSTRSHVRCRPEGNVARRRDRRIRRRADHGVVERDRGEDLQCAGFDMSTIDSVSFPGPPIVGLRCSSRPGFWSLPMIITWASAAFDPRRPIPSPPRSPRTPALTRASLPPPIRRALTGFAVMLTRYATRGKDSASTPHIARSWNVKERVSSAGTELPGWSNGRSPKAQALSRGTEGSNPSSSSGESVSPANSGAIGEEAPPFAAVCAGLGT